MSDEIEAYPLTWPVGRPRAKSRQDGQFDSKVTIGKTRDQLMAELGRFGASRVIISSNMRLRLDGLPYGQQSQPNDPGVAVYFSIKGVPHVIACDRYYKVQHNLRAIAKTIEAQRGILRWGAVTAEQVFAGFKALPPGQQPIVPGVAMTPEQAARVIGGIIGLTNSFAIDHSPDTFQSCYKAALAKLHPDRNGGETSPMWADLQSAIAVLKRHHKI